MGKTKFPAQKTEIQGWLRNAHLDYSELARRIGFQAQTIEKYAEGWQECSESTLHHIKTVCDNEALRLEMAAGKSTAPAELHDEVVAYAGKLLELPATKQRLAKELIDQLGRGCGEVSSTAKGIRGIALTSGLKHLQAHGHKAPPVGQPSEHTSASAQSSHQESTPLQPRPTPGPKKRDS